ncbi:hypothetical protein GUJ93_ZPchr0004g38800 [Zizania palustris]|uniref:Uncharacterized protein n=1 Tax=Zizania palustris TaxID=103762 RepID=A0A8J5V9G6_ZIZPA|nr:hypothetical protein GUJ93_ZPchr0004g38800 [Zizania palustris]
MPPAAVAAQRRPGTGAPKQRQRPEMGAPKRRNDPQAEHQPASRGLAPATAATSKRWQWAPRHRRRQRQGRIRWWRLLGY